MAAVLVVGALYSWRWGPHLDENGDPPSAYDGTDTFGFHFVSTASGSGFCEGSCSGSQTDILALSANVVVGVALIAGFAFLMATARARLTRP